MEQPQYNVLHRDKVEAEFAALYARHGLGLTTFSPLRFGLLSGKYNAATIPPDSRFGAANADLDPFIRSFRDKFGAAEDAEMKQQLAVSQHLAAIAAELGVTQAQLCIAWALKNSHVSSVITGASRPEQVVDNVGAIRAVAKLTPDVMARIDAAAANRPKKEQDRFGVPGESLGVQPQE